MERIEDLLKENAYPGRGILVGRSSDGRSAVIAYFIMGRSENSRNRVFALTDDGIVTKAHDESKMVDPSLIIYAPVRKAGGQTIVTNGDQTDTIYDYLTQGKSFEAALLTRTFEPDAPNFTPRISALVTPEGGGFSFEMGILRTVDGDPNKPYRAFWHYDMPAKGTGRFLHTYAGDGAPRIPSFEEEPEEVLLEGDIDTVTGNLWESLNKDNRVSLFTRFIDLATGEETTWVTNKNEPKDK